MDKLMIVVFEDEKRATEGYEALRGLHEEGSITLHAEAILARDKDGRVSVRKRPEPSHAGSLFGLIIGALVGVLGGPIGAGNGPGSGTLVGAAFDLTRVGVGKEFLNEVTKVLTSGKWAVVAELDEEWQTPVDIRMDELAGRIFRRNLLEVEDAYYEAETAVRRAEITTLEAELETVPAARRATLQARIDDLRRKLQDKEDQLEARMDALEREGEARVTLLDKQSKAARKEIQARLERRRLEVREDYRLRGEKLHEAWERTRSALTP